jgi:hypothetical protein
VTVALFATQDPDGSPEKAAITGKPPETQVVELTDALRE